MVADKNLLAANLREQTRIKIGDWNRFILLGKSGHLKGQRQISIDRRGEKQEDGKPGQVQSSWGRQP